MENNTNSQETLQISDEEKLAMAEQIILTGSCKYSFNILNKFPVVLKSLTFEEQEELTSEISQIPNEVIVPDQYDQKEDGGLVPLKRPLSVPEYNLMVTKLSLTKYLYSFNDKLITSPEDLKNIGEPVIKILSEKVRSLTRTIDKVITSAENIKN